MDFTNLVAHAGVEKDPLGGRGLASVNVRGNTNVAVVFNGGSAGHKLLSVRCYEQRLVAKIFLLFFYASAGRALLAPSRQELGLNRQVSRCFGHLECLGAIRQIHAVNTAIDLT
jgi:hypothetical protein